MTMKIENAAVAAVFDAYPPAVKKRLLRLRDLIFETAAATEGVGALEETLKWGRPSYLTPETKSGSTIRIDRHKSGDGRTAMFFHCQTRLVDTFRDMFRDDLAFEGNRAIVFDAGDELPEAPLRHCIAMALTYHLNKKKKRR
jgi:Domain of unknown function (DU1801)